MLGDEQTMSNYSPQPDSTGLSDPNYIYVFYLAILKKKKKSDCIAWMKPLGLHAVKIISSIVENASTILHLLVQNRRITSSRQADFSPPTLFLHLTFYNLNWLHWYLIFSYKLHTLHLQDHSGYCNFSCMKNKRNRMWEHANNNNGNDGSVF